MSRASISEDLYAKLMNEEDARACRALDERACRVVPGNFLLILCTQLLTKLGDAIANPKIVLPWIFEAIGAPLYLLGLLVPIRESGSMLPQLVIAGYIRRLPIRKWVWVGGSLLQALCILAMAAVAWQLRGAAAGWAIIALLVLFSLARGLCSVAAKDVIGKTIPKQRRGRLNGWSASAAGLVTLAGGVWLVVGQHWSEAAGYGLLLAVGGLLWLSAALLYARIREYPGETDGAANALVTALARLDLLRTEPIFRRFVIARALFLCSALTAPYYVVLAQQQLGTPGWLLGLFIIASGAASLLSGPIWGRFADHSSRRVMRVSALLAALLGILVWLLATWREHWLQTLWLLPLCYFCLSIAHQGVRIGRKTYIVDLAEGNRRTDYVAVSNTVIGAVLLVAGVSGALATVLGLAELILLYSLAGLAGVWLASGLPEAGEGG